MRILLICAVLTAAALGASQSDRVARPDRVERMGQFSSDRSVVAAAFSRADQRAARSGVDPYSPLDRVAAFARLYGAVRFFYPSDAAARTDWQRFAIEGVRRAREARDVKSLEATLEQLFQPLGPGIDIAGTLPPARAAATSEGLIAWRYVGAGFDGTSVTGPYRGKRTHRAPPTAAGIDGFVTLMQNVAADSHVGKRIRLRGQVRATSRDASGSAALWLRVDRGDRGMGFFDNMGDRPIVDGHWRQYEIEGPVADDATNIAFGIMASGSVSADFDSIELAVRNANGEWTVVPIRDPGFEESAPGQPGGWFRAGSSKMALVSRPSDRAPEGRQFARVSAPPAPAADASSLELFDEAPPGAGDHVDIDLGLGLKARVPLALTAEAARAGSVSSISQASASDLDIRLADVIVAWNILRHFYPYWAEAGIDWDAKLSEHISAMFMAESRDEHRDGLRRLVADVRDGHGRVIDMRQRQPQSALPIRLRRIEGRVVVTASDVPGVPVGAVVSAIDGVPATQRLDAEMNLASGTTQWRESRAVLELTTCTPGAAITLVTDVGAGTRSSTLPCDAKQPPSEQRPDPVSELGPRVWYMDLTRARMSDIRPKLSALASAAGVVFDLRGYPTDAGAQIIPHLLDKPENDRWMHVAKIVGPFGRIAGWQSFGWNVGPASPRLAGTVVFMTDGRAISYAESVMGYIADRKLATIVGSPTAGANGNVAAFAVPGGFRISFTGMRVTGHDGSSQHHLVGIKPDVPLEPTIAGVRAGRDELLERALAIASTGRR